MGHIIRRIMTIEQLRDELVSAFELLQQQNSVLHDLMNEIAAIRDALIEAGPKYKEILDRHRASGGFETTPLQDRDSIKFDEVIQRLKRG